MQSECRPQRTEVFPDPKHNAEVADGFPTSCLSDAIALQGSSSIARVVTAHPGIAMNALWASTGGGLGAISPSVEVWERLEVVDSDVIGTQASRFNRKADESRDFGRLVPCSRSPHSCQSVVFHKVAGNGGPVDRWRWLCSAEPAGDVRFTRASGVLADRVFPRKRSESPIPCHTCK